MADMYAPDWLLKSGEDGPLVEDSPAHPLQDQIEQQKKQEAMRQSMAELQARPPREMFRNLRPDSAFQDYEPANPEPTAPSPIGPPLSAPDTLTSATSAAREQLPMPGDDPSNDHLVNDPHGTIALIAKETGMPIKQVATFAMLGAHAKKQQELDRMAGLPTPEMHEDPRNQYDPNQVQQPPAEAQVPLEMAPQGSAPTLLPPSPPELV